VGSNPTFTALTCKNAGLVGRRARASYSASLIWSSRLRACAVPATGNSCAIMPGQGCCGPAWAKRHTPARRVPRRSGLAGTVRDRPDARQLTDRTTL